jgi:hypothetical protein
VTFRRFPNQPTHASDRLPRVRARHPAGVQHRSYCSTESDRQEQQQLVMDPDYRCVASFHRSRRILREPGRELLFFRESFRVDFGQRRKLVRIYITICIYITSVPRRGSFVASASFLLVRTGGYVDSEWRRVASNGTRFVLWCVRRRRAWYVSLETRGISGWQGR